MEPATKRMRLSLNSMYDEVPDVERIRKRNEQKLKGTFESIFDKYGRQDDDDDDVIDLQTGAIVEDNGHIRRMRHDRDLGKRPAKAAATRNVAANSDEDDDEDELSTPERTDKTMAQQMRPPPRPLQPKQPPRAIQPHSQPVQNTYNNQEMLPPPSAPYNFTATDPQSIAMLGHNIAHSLAFFMSQYQQNPMQAPSAGAPYCYPPQQRPMDPTWWAPPIWSASSHQPQSSIAHSQQRYESGTTTTVRFTTPQTDRHQNLPRESVESGPGFRRIAPSPSPAPSFYEASRSIWAGEPGASRTGSPDSQYRTRGERYSKTWSTEEHDTLSEIVEQMKSRHLHLREMQQVLSEKLPGRSFAAIKHHTWRCYGTITFESTEEVQGHVTGRVIELPSTPGPAPQTTRIHFEGPGDDGIQQEELVLIETPVQASVSNETISAGSEQGHIADEGAQESTSTKRPSRSLPEVIADSDPPSDIDTEEQRSSQANIPASIHDSNIPSVPSESRSSLSAGSARTPSQPLRTASANKIRQARSSSKSTPLRSAVSITTPSRGTMMNSSPPVGNDESEDELA